MVNAVSMSEERNELRFLWLEITGQCQLACTHCYADSGPSGTHGTMHQDDWLRVLDQAVLLGVETVQFIGGEPTLHPSLPTLVRRALELAMEVEIYTNLVRVTDAMWAVFQQPGVRLATSYYSIDAAQHNAVTGHPSHGKTMMNIVEAQRRGIPLRVGVVVGSEEQRVAETVGGARAVGNLSGFGVRQTEDRPR